MRGTARRSSPRYLRVEQAHEVLEVVALERRLDRGDVTSSEGGTGRGRRALVRERRAEANQSEARAHLPERLAVAEEQMPARRQIGVEAVEERDNVIVAEIDQHVATERNRALAQLEGRRVHGEVVAYHH